MRRVPRPTIFNIVVASSWRRAQRCRHRRHDVSPSRERCRCTPVAFPTAISHCVHCCARGHRDYRRARVSNFVLHSFFNIPPTTNSKFEISPAPEPRLRALLSACRRHRTYSPTVQNFGSSFELAASKKMSLLLCRRPRCSTPTSVHHHPLCPWLNTSSGARELLRTVTHRFHFPPIFYWSGMKFDSGPLLHFLLEKLPSNSRSTAKLKLNSPSGISGLFSFSGPPLHSAC
ncbi:hypothetical protein DFH06DRAFT_1329175 [Mycena polygramma]|nr:hypothetical protein DFH06DRAFT_1329175 [Mycena polygramma]